MGADMERDRNRAGLLCGTKGPGERSDGGSPDFGIRSGEIDKIHGMDVQVETAVRAQASERRAGLSRSLRNTQCSRTGGMNLGCLEPHCSGLLEPAGRVLPQGDVGADPQFRRGRGHHADEAPVPAILRSSRPGALLESSARTLYSGHTLDKPSNPEHQERKPTGAVPTMPCPRCGHQMIAIRGSTGAVCTNCGFKDSCCY